MVDRENIEDFYRRYGPMVYRRCFRILKNEESALDATQEVFVQVMRRQRVLTAIAPSSLLYRIATNISLNHLRSEKRREETMDDSILHAIAGSDDHVRLTEARDTIDALFESEKETTKTIAVYHYIDRLTLEETAELTGLSVSGVRKRLKKLRKKVEIFQEV